MRSKLQVFRENLIFYHTHLHLNPPYCPYHILLDAPFICSVIANRIPDILEYLEKQFGATCKLLTTHCVQYHLLCEFPNNGPIDRLMAKLQTYPCSHTTSCPAPTTYECVFEIASQNQFKRSIGPPRGRQYVHGETPRVIVATQNLSLLEALREVIAVPLMYFDKKIILEKPTDDTLKWVGIKRFRMMEMLTTEMEILEHGVEDPEDHKVAGKSESGKQTNQTQLLGAAAPEETTSQPRTKCSRELSPDITDLTDIPRQIKVTKKKARKFDKYKSLYRENSRHSRHERGTPKSRDRLQVKSSTFPSYAFQLTNTSSFEFEIEDNQN